MLGYDIPNLSAFQVKDIEVLEVEVGKRCFAGVNREEDCDREGLGKVKNLW